MLRWTGGIHLVVHVCVDEGVIEVNLMTEEFKRPEDCHKDAKTAICAGSCIDVIGDVVLEVASHAYACFVTNKIFHIIEFVSENPFDWWYLFVL